MIDELREAFCTVPLTAHYSPGSHIGRGAPGKNVAERIKANFRLGLVESVCDVHARFLKTLNKRDRGKFSHPLKCCEFHPKCASIYPKKCKAPC